MLTINFTSCKLNRILAPFFTSGILAAMGIFSGIVPEIFPQFPNFSFVAYAYAQDYTKEEVVNYARAGFAVEMLRQRVYQEIKAIINEPPPDIVCNQPETFQNLSGDVKDIAIRYCNDSSQIVKNNNLSVSRFNELKQVYDRGGDFYHQVQNALIDMQSPNP
jgi:hypothetical protein